jgi:probable rRNA maturation factor
MNVVLVNHQRTRKIDLRLLKQIADALLAELKIQNADLEINFVSVGEMTRINKEFLQHAGSTDVITFDYSTPGGRTPDARRQLHGEIFICVDEAVLQARTFRTTWQLEMVRCLIHGVLHLLGHDDSHVGKRRKMKREENRLLRQLSRRFSLAQLARAAKLSRCKNR